MDKITINNDYKAKFNHVISLNTNNGRHNNSQPNNRPNQFSSNNIQRQQPLTYSHPNNRNNNNTNRNLPYTPNTIQENYTPNYKAMEDKI